MKLNFKEFIEYSSSDKCMYEGIKILSNLKDNDIERVSKNLYKFTSNNKNYKIKIASELDKGLEYITIDFILGDNIVSRTKNDKPSFDIYNKVITCITDLLEKDNVQRFKFTSRDERLSKFYDVLFVRFRKEYPFDQYYWHKMEIKMKNKDDMSIYYFSKNSKDLEDLEKLVEDYGPAWNLGIYYEN